MAQNDIKICDICGAECNIKDTYCKKCSNPFSVASMTPEEMIIDGLDNADVRQFIDKNNDYYEKKFKKSKGKKWYPQLNWAAFFFGAGWFLYRKMYKVAVIYLAVCLGVSMLLQIAVPAIFKEDIDNFFYNQEQYENCNTMDTWLKYEESEESSLLKPTKWYQEIIDAKEASKDRIRNIYCFYIIIPTIIVNMLPRFFGNALYKNFITENVDKKAGGVSWGWAVLWYLCGDIVSSAVALLLIFIPIAYDFQKALEVALF